MAELSNLLRLVAFVGVGNDCLWYSHLLGKHFQGFRKFTDIFFVTKTAEISRGYTYMQIFVSDKWYVFIAAMKSVSEFPKALKMFAKEVGVPEAIISDSYKCHKSKEV